MLEARDLVRTFGGLVVIADFKFEICQGEVLGLTGPNDAGKSTTFNVITGFYRPGTGEVRFMNQRIDGLDSSRISRLCMARTFQHESLLSEMTVYDNIMVAVTAFVASRTSRDQWVRQTVALMGIDSVLNEGAGSMHQRVLSITTGLAMRPSLVYRDEPLAGINQTAANAALSQSDFVRQAYFGN